MTPHLEQRFRKAYPSVCQIVLRRLVEWKWGRMCLPYTFCAGLPYLRAAARLPGFRPTFPQFIRIWPYLQGFAVLLMMTGPVDDDKNGAFFITQTLVVFPPPARCRSRFLGVADVTRRGAFFMGDDSGAWFRS